MQPIADYGAFFDGASRALEESAAIRSALKSARDSRAELEERLQGAMEDLEAAISKEQSDQRGQISRTYDIELDGTKKKLAKAQEARRKAKNKGVKERITEETSQLHAENRSIQGKITESLRSRGLPAFCEGRLFNILYLPQGLLDHVLLLLLQLLCYVAFPTAVVLILNITNLWIVVAAFTIVMLLCNAVYFSILRNMVYKNYDILSEAVECRRQIRDNAARIEEIADGIRNDPDEGTYDLGAYDDEIAGIEEEISKIVNDRKAALEVFDRESSAAIADKLTKEAQPQIDELKSGIEEAALKVTELESQNRLKNQELTKDYEPYLGKKYMTRERIEALREIINHGTAANITEAKEEYEHRMEG